MKYTNNASVKGETILLQKRICASMRNLTKHALFMLLFFDKSNNMGLTVCYKVYFYFIMRKFFWYNPMTQTILNV